MVTSIEGSHATPATGVQDHHRGLGCGVVICGLIRILAAAIAASSGGGYRGARLVSTLAASRVHGEALLHGDCHKGGAQHSRLLQCGIGPVSRKHSPATAAAATVATTATATVATTAAALVAATATAGGAALAAERAEAWWTKGQSRSDSRLLSRQSEGGVSMAAHAVPRVLTYHGSGRRSRRHRRHHSHHRRRRLQEDGGKSAATRGVHVIRGANACVLLSVMSTTNWLDTHCGALGAAHSQCALGGLRCPGRSWPLRSY